MEFSPITDPEFYEIVLPRPLVAGLHATVRPRRPAHLGIYALGCRELRVDWVRLKDLAGIIALLGVWDESKPRGEMQEVIEHDLARGFVLICDLKHKLAHPHIGIGGEIHKLASDKMKERLS